MARAELSLPVLPFPRASPRLSSCKTSHTSRRVKFGLPRAELPHSSGGCSMASPAPSKAISKQLYLSRWLRRCAPAAGQARTKPVSGAGLRSIVALSRSGWSHVSAFPWPAIFRLSLRCLRCFAFSGRALLQMTLNSCSSPSYKAWFNQSCN